MPRPKERDTNRKLRYFTYYIHFPDGDVWVDQTPFIHDLQFELKRSVWKADWDAQRNLLQKGDHHWKDHNGVTHRIVIEDKKRPRKWGVKKGIQVVR